MSNVLSFSPKVAEKKREAQLDLFSWSYSLTEKYNFFDVYNSNEDLLDKSIKKIGFTAAIDLRVFPTFDSPKYNHKRVLDKFAGINLYYFPYSYMRALQVENSIMADYREKFASRLEQGPLLIFIDSAKCSEAELMRYRKIARMTLSGRAEVSEKFFTF